MTPFDAVVALLVSDDEGWFTIADIAALAGVTESAARYHTAALLRAGRVQVEMTPPRMYRWTDMEYVDEIEDATNPEHVIGLTFG